MRGDAREPGEPAHVVGINEDLRAVLRALPSRLRSAFVFPSEAGDTPLDSQNFINRVFAPALKKARITDFSWHDLRHSFASRLAMAGVDMRTVQELMGHATLTMTLRYAHLSPAHKLEAVRRLERPADTPNEAANPAPEPALAVSSGSDGNEPVPASGRVLDGKQKWRRAGSNSRPRDYETLALAN